MYDGRKRKSQRKQWVGGMTLYGCQVQVLWVVGHTPTPNHDNRNVSRHFQLSPTGQIVSENWSAGLNKACRWAAAPTAATWNCPAALSSADVLIVLRQVGKELVRKWVENCRCPGGDYWIRYLRRAAGSTLFNFQTYCLEEPSLELIALNSLWYLDGLGSNRNPQEPWTGGWKG